VGQDFIRLAILAYECGYTEEVVKQEMIAACLQVRHGESLTTITHVTSWSCVLILSKNRHPVQENVHVMQKLDIEECILYTCVVWITLMLVPSRTVVRWSAGDLHMLEPLVCISSGKQVPVQVSRFMATYAGVVLVLSVQGLLLQT
jgi:hypothetical protein